MKNKLLAYEIIGMVFSIFFGSALHFAFQWSDYSKIVALVAAVNESTWEHLKLGFWPLLIWAGLESFVFKRGLKNFALGKGLSILSFCCLIPIIFYSYKSVIGGHNLIFDIFTFMVSIIMAQLISFFTLSKAKDLNLNLFGMVLIIILLGAFMTFSFFPPKIFLFKDPVTGGYGIVH